MLFGYQAADDVTTPLRLPARLNREVREPTERQIVRMGWRDDARQITRIRLSDKTSRLRPRHVVPKPAQTYEPEVPIEVREWIAPAPSSPDFVLEAQPPAQPHRRVSIERPIRLADGSYREVVRPSAQRAVHFAHQRCGLLPCARSVGQRVDLLD